MVERKERESEKQFRTELGMVNVYPEKVIATRTDRKNTFTAPEIKINWVRAFGGQFIGNAISALSQTVADDFPIHSIHGYFIHGGVFIRSTISVKELRSGKSFETRSCTIKQEDKIVFTALSSFKKEEKSIFVPFDFRENIPESFLPRLNFQPESYEQGNIWGNIERRVIASNERNDLYLYKYNNPVKKDDWRINTTILGFMTDIYLMNTLIKNFPDVERTDWLAPSLDHSIHFHKPRKIYVNDWLYFFVTVQVVDSGRVLFTSRIFNLDEELLASVSQEMLIRVRNKM
eukprot:maker-scaffold_1-snap-gene-9.12-mRNA-1 protein AED:0.01 eAED:0.01 QI:23/1/1/1/1/1/3/94/288